MTHLHFNHRGAFQDGKAVVWLVGAGLFLLLALRVQDIIGGAVPDNDDLLRIQQVRDLLAGQSWFNVDQARMLTPEGGEMHWSRLPDLFLASVIWLTRPFLGETGAEIVAMSLWPLTLLVAAMVLMVISMRRLGLPVAAQAIGLLFFGVSAAIYNFWPGRIDHHNLVVVLTLLGLAAVSSVHMTKRSGLVLGFAITAMVSVAIESLPYAAVLIGLLGLFWIVRGHREAERLCVFGISLCGFAVLFYAFDAPGWSSRRMVCDAYGTSHFAGFVFGGVALAGLGAFAGALRTWQSRLVVGSLAGAATLALMVVVNPACLGDPYAEVSDTVRLAWLSVVGEAKTFATLLEGEPARIVWVFGYISVAVIAAALMLYRSAPERRLVRIGFVALFAVSILTTIWQIRGQSFSHVFASISAGWLVGAAFLNWWNKRGSGPILTFASAAIFCAPVTWEAISKAFDKPLAYADAEKSYNVLCTDAEAYAGLKTLPEMRVFTSIDVSMSVLSRSPHSVFAGPYHRNVKGIEQVTGILIGPPEDALAGLQALGATHFLYCRGLNETNRYGLVWPDSFAAALNRDELPGWLKPVDGLSETDDVVRLYKIVPDASDGG